MKTAIIYGSTTGNTETVAKSLAGELADLEPDIRDVVALSIEEFASYDILLLGVPTWNIGELQSDWDEFVGKLPAADLSGKRVAIFGCGDEVGYADTFADAHGLLWEALKPLGATLFGLWPTDGYDFTDSKAIVDDKFIGLVIDEDNHSDLTEERVKTWAKQIKEELAAAAI